LSTAVPASAAPKRLGDYALDAEIGRGAFGVVYRGHHRDRPDVPVALKVIAGRGNTDRLLLEPAMLSRLSHPCIVGLEDYFLRGGDLVLVLEYVAGRDLKTLLDEDVPFSQEDIRDLLTQLGSALAAAHAQNVVHRDIKHANVLVTRTEEGRYRFVLTDFGIGQVAEGLQQEKRAGGTYLFMAPEQLRGRPGPQSDLWALGVVAYRLLTGRMPFPGPSLRELTTQVLYRSPQLPSEVCGEPVDPQLEKAIMRLLDKSLQERTASAEELPHDLGHRGPADSVLTRGSAPRAARGGKTLDRQLRRAVTWRVVALVVCVALYLLPAGLFAGLLVVAGLALFVYGQRLDGRTRRAVLATLGAFGLLAGANALRYAFAANDVSFVNGMQWLQRSTAGAASGGPPQTAPGPGGPPAGQAPAGIGPRGRPPIGRLKDPLPQRFQPPALEPLPRPASPQTSAPAPRRDPMLALILVLVVAVAAILLAVVYLFLPVIAASLFATIRRLQREQLLRDLAREEGTGSDRYLEALRHAVDSRFEDVGLHLKYAEALFARGELAQAAVEARLLLRQDPYHFGGNLLLANAYLGLGLDAECVEVCDRYLAVSGHCFELAELREQCLRRAAA
jgi:hypothetical protein